MHNAQLFNSQSIMHKAQSTREDKTLDFFNPFANNEIPFEVDNEPDWSRFTEGLNVATYNYMRQTGFDVPLKRWFR